MEMHKVNPEQQEGGLSLEYVEAALNVRFDWLKRMRTSEAMYEWHAELYNSFIALRQAQAMEEAVNQLMRIRMELNWMRRNG